MSLHVYCMNVHHSPNTVKTDVLLEDLRSKWSGPVWQEILVPLFLKVAFTSSTDSFSRSSMTPWLRKVWIITLDESWMLLICHTTTPVVLHAYLATEFTGTVWFWGGSKICAAVPAIDCSTIQVNNLLLQSHSKFECYALSVVCPTLHTWSRCWRKEGDLSSESSPRGWYLVGIVLIHSNCIINYIPFRYA